MPCADKRIEKYLFIVPSLTGVMLFMLPVKFGGAVNTVIGFIEAAVISSASVYGHLFMGAVVASVFVFSVYVRAFKPFWARHSVVISHNLLSPLPGFLLRLIALPVAFAAYLHPNVIPAGLNEYAVGMLGHIVPLMIVLTFLLALLLPLALNFGLVQFIAVYANYVMRKVFLLPGHAAVDCLISCFASSSTAIVVTDRMYKAGYYNGREAGIVATAFSVTSIADLYMLTALLYMEQHFVYICLSFYCTTFLLAFIMARVMPLLGLDFGGSGARKSEAQAAESAPDFRAAFDAAVRHAKHMNAVCYLRESADITVSLLCGTLPLMILLGSAVTPIIHATPVPGYISAPFTTFYRALGLDCSDVLGSSAVLAFIDPYLALTNINAFYPQATRMMWIGVTNIGLVNMTEVGVHILHSSIPVKFRHMLVIFIFRVVVGSLLFMPFCTILD